jgi:hypothetical protein
MELNINTKVVLSDEDIANILVTAFEGGINYWCKKVKMMKTTVSDDVWDREEKIIASDFIGLGGKLRLYDAEEPSDENWILDAEKLKKGLEMYFSDCGENSEVSFDAGNIDAGDADSIIQYALFGELVYG